jgi:hypothetical protein
MLLLLWKVADKFQHNISKPENKKITFLLLIRADPTTTAAGILIASGRKWHECRDNGSSQRPDKMINSNIAPVGTAGSTQDVDRFFSREGA